MLFTCTCITLIPVRDVRGGAFSCEENDNDLDKYYLTMNMTNKLKTGAQAN